jgi:hypothetical protein
MANTRTTTVRPDSNGRIALGGLAKGVSSFRIHKAEGGRLVLEPFAEIPASELWLYKNPEALAMVEQGLRESAEGKTVRMDSFAKYLDDED